ncbi:MAG TPA: hypothetical protein HA348_00510 [Thermoplasmata archaeon]|nr:hypothetical protein [Thermoplasmata archaeon]
MKKGTSIMGVVLLATGLALYASAGSLSNEPAEFIKLLSEAESYFLAEDYGRASIALEKAQKILKQQIKLRQKTTPFFNLSTPENAVKSFLESAVLNDEETARRCWSKRVPDYFVSMMVSAMQKEIERRLQEELKLPKGPQLVKWVAKTFRYEKIWTGVNSYYVRAIPPGEERSEGLQFRVVRENSNWKVLVFKVWEEEGWFKALTGKK